MNEQYSINEKVYENKRKGPYVPVSVKIFKEGQLGFDYYAHPWHKLWIDRKLDKGTPVYIVSYIQHSGSDHYASAFLSESVSRKYAISLAKAIGQKQGTDHVELHHNGGVQTIYKVIHELPLNNYVNFRTPTHEYYITLAKTIY